MIFFGTSPFAVPSLAALLAGRHHVACVVTQPARPAGRNRKLEPSPVKRKAQEEELPVEEPEELRDPSFLEGLRARGAGLAVVVAYGKILPLALLRLFPQGAINLHPSLLPKYRGAAPIQRALLQGETQTGVTVFQLDDRLDHGPVLFQRSCPIEETDDALTLSKKLEGLGSELLGQAVQALEGKGVQGKPQEEGEATYAPRLTKEEGIIDWKMPALSIHRLIRGVQPWPGAQTFLRGKLFKILCACAEPHRDIPGALPGTVVSSGAPEGLVVQTGQGLIKLLKVQGASGKAMAWDDFIRGHPIPAGTSFIV